MKLQVPYEGVLTYCFVGLGIQVGLEVQLFLRTRPGSQLQRLRSAVQRRPASEQEARLSVYKWEFPKYKGTLF